MFELRFAIVAETESPKQKLVSTAVSVALFDVITRFTVSLALQPNDEVNSIQYAPDDEVWIDEVVEELDHKYVAPEDWYELVLPIEIVGLLTQLISELVKSL